MLKTVNTAVQQMGVAKLSLEATPWVPVGPEEVLALAHPEIVRTVIK